MGRGVRKRGKWVDRHDESPPSKIPFGISYGGIQGGVLTKAARNRSVIES
jgi:hypothetical protein